MLCVSVCVRKLILVKADYSFIKRKNYYLLGIGRIVSVLLLRQKIKIVFLHPIWYTIF